MQGQRNTSTLQGHQHSQDTVRQPKRQKLQSKQNWDHVPLQMPTHELPRSKYRGIREGSRWQSQRTSQGTFPIHQHSTTTGHPLDPDHFNTVHKEVNSHSRTIKESMFICVYDPKLNRNLGKYQLLHIWYHLLQASPMLQLKPCSPPAPHSSLTTPLPYHPTPTTYAGGIYFSW